jgi:hypothetical protein
MAWMVAITVVVDTAIMLKISTLLCSRKLHSIKKNASPEKIVGIVNRLQTGGTGVHIRAGVRRFLPSPKVHIASGAHQASYSISIGALSRGIKRPGRKGNHSFP